LAKEMMEKYPGFPAQFFFRNIKGDGATVGRQFGKDRMANAWKKACEKLGVEGVPLYRGTKASTISALGGRYSLEQIRMASGHASIASFNHYWNRGNEDAKAAGVDNTISIKDRTGK
jgi:integrase